MQWQEVVFLIGQMLFNVALLPSILGKDKPALKTSLPTTTIIFVYVVIYMTLSLWVTAISVFTTGILWGVLAYQKYSAIKKGQKTEPIV